MSEKAKDETAPDNSNKQTEVEAASYSHESPATKHSVFNGIKFTRKLAINSVCALDVLKNYGYNWFEFVACAEEEMFKCCCSEGVLNQFLIDFAGQLSELGLSKEEEKLVEHTRQAFLALRR